MYSRFGLLIDGAWRPASDGATLTVASPVTEMAIGTVPAASEADQQAALDAAARASPRWAAVPAWERAAILRRTADGSLEARLTGDQGSSLLSLLSTLTHDR